MKSFRENTLMIPSFYRPIYESISNYNQTEVDLEQFTFLVN